VEEKPHCSKLLEPPANLAHRTKLTVIDRRLANLAFLVPDSGYATPLRPRASEILNLTTVLSSEDEIVVTLTNTALLEQVGKN
jgi:hypothetical protein